MPKNFVEFLICALFYMKTWAYHYEHGICIRKESQVLFFSTCAKNKREVGIQKTETNTQCMAGTHTGAQRLREDINNNAMSFSLRAAWNMVNFFCVLLFSYLRDIKKFRKKVFFSGRQACHNYCGVLHPDCFGLFISRALKFSVVMQRGDAL